MAVKVAIAGAGLMGRWHAHAAERAGGRVVAVVDRDRGRAQRLASRHRGARAFKDAEASFDIADVVHICTPTQTHVALAGAALAARRPVLVEKPLAPTAADTQELVRLAETHAVML